MKAENIQPEMVRVKRGRKAFIPALLLRIDGKSAVIKPMGHRRSETVPLGVVKRWKSRARNDATAAICRPARG